MIELNNKTGVLLVDVQNDFCPGGSLAVREGDAVVSPLNEITRLAAEKGSPIAASRDWHPADTKHFEKWPVHCVQNSPGAEFHEGLNIQNAEILSKGTSHIDDGYSSFEGVNEKGQSLDEFYTERGVTDILIGGFATDYCVKASALDAVSKGYNTYVLLDGIRAVDLQENDGKEAIDEMRDSGVIFISSNVVN